MDEYKHYKLRCKTMTPVHIGTGESLASIGDYYTSSNRLFIIDKAKLDLYIDPVNNKDFFVRYLSEIKKNVSLSKSDFSIVPFLKENGIELEKVTSEIAVPIMTSGYKSHKNSQLKLAVKQKKQLYLPGSSIKGAIKTALFYHYLISNPDVLSKWNKSIENSSSKQKYLEEWATSVERGFNQFFKGEKCDYNLLRIDDSPSLDNECRGVWETARFHLYKSNEEILTWLTEAIAPGTSFNMGITLLPKFNVNFLKFLNDADITTIFSIINKFSKDQLVKEIKEIETSRLSQEVKSIIVDQLKQLLNVIQNDNQAIIRIGAGKSFFYNTVCTLLDKTHMEILRSTVKIGKIDESIFPLTRTITTDYKQFGWILMELQPIEIGDLPVNIISEIENNITELEAVIVNDRKVRVKLNETEFDVQLVLPMEHKNIHLTKGEHVNVVVKQISKDKRIIQVNFKSKI